VSNALWETGNKTTIDLCVGEAHIKGVETTNMETDMALQRMIYCPGPDKWLTLGQYVKVVKTAKAAKATEFKCGITCWWPVTGAEVVNQFYRGVEDRINRAIPYTESAIYEGRF
jgi:hypothetical protein